MSGDEASEHALWQRALAGEGDAIGPIYDMHRDRVFRHAFLILQHHADAEDASGVAFLELWRRRRHVRLVDDSVLAWLLVTAGNACRNLDRSRRRYRMLLQSLPHPVQQLSAEDLAASGLALDTELAAAVRALSARDAELLALVALQDYSVTDAAQAIGISAGAARTRLHRVRAKLQQQLGHTTLAGYLSKEAT